MLLLQSDKVRCTIEVQTPECIIAILLVNTITKCIEHDEKSRLLFHMETQVFLWNLNEDHNTNFTAIFKIPSGFYMHV
jgi:hypothetical protein